jgi:hypothetical protein
MKTARCLTRIAAVAVKHKHQRRGIRFGGRRRIDERRARHAIHGELHFLKTIRRAGEGNEQHQKRNQVTAFSLHKDSDVKIAKMLLKFHAICSLGARPAGRFNFLRYDRLSFFQAAFLMNTEAA